jgi:hypothetical protein
MSDNVCKNCGQPLDGNFCKHCGQAASVHRVNAAYFLHDIPHSVLHVDKGLFYTFTRLIKQPGKTLEDYLAGKRINHFRPLGYVLMLSAITALLVHWNLRLVQYLELQKTGTILPITERFFAKYQSIFIFLMIPLVSVCTWLIFKKNRYNFWEHMLVNTYLAAQLNMLVIVTQLFILINYLVTGRAYNPSIIFTTIFMTGFMTYYAIAFSRLMRGQEQSAKLGLRLTLMCFILASLYATSMAFAGITSPI